MKYRATALAAVFALAACGGGSDDASVTTEPDPVAADEPADVEEFAPASIDAAAVCAAVPSSAIEPLFEFAAGVFGEPSTLEGKSQCNYTAANGDASLLVNAGVGIENEGGAAGFAAMVEKWEKIADVVQSPGVGDDAVTVTDANGHESMFVLDGERVLRIDAGTASSDKSIVDVFPELALIAVDAL